MNDASFPTLVWRLCCEHHDGIMLRMSERTGIHYQTLYKWMHGRARQPNLMMVQDLCRTYRLNLENVFAIIQHDVARYVERRRVELPDFSHIKRGPIPHNAPMARMPLAAMPARRRKKARVA